MTPRRRIVLDALKQSQSAMTTSQVSDALNMDIKACRYELKLLHMAKKIHISGWSVPYVACMYMHGPGTDVPEPMRKKEKTGKSKWSTQKSIITAERKQRAATTMMRRDAVRGSVWETVI